MFVASATSASLGRFENAGFGDVEDSTTRIGKFMEYVPNVFSETDDRPCRESDVSSSGRREGA